MNAEPEILLTPIDFTLVHAGIPRYSKENSIPSRIWKAEFINGIGAQVMAKGYGADQLDAVASLHEDYRDMSWTEKP